MNRKTRKNPIATAKDLVDVTSVDAGGGNAQFVIGGVAGPLFTPTAAVWSGITGKPTVVAAGATAADARATVGLTSVPLTDYASAVVGGDWSPAVTALLAAYTSPVRITIGPGNFSFSTGINLGTFYALDLDASTLTYTGTSGALITLGEHGQLTGSGTLNGPGQTSTTVALQCAGPHSRGKGSFEVYQFGTGWSAVHNNTYITSFDGFRFNHCGLGVDAQITGGITTTGEAFRFRNCTFASCNKFFAISGNVVDTFFDQCSFDYPWTDGNSFGSMNTGAITFFNQCHFECGTENPVTYLFDISGVARSYFNQCSFSMFTDATCFIVNPATDDYGSFVGFQQCVAYFVPTSGTPYKTAYSEHQVFTAAGGNYTHFDTPFLSKSVLASLATHFHADAVAEPLVPKVYRAAAGSTQMTVEYPSAVTYDTNCIVRFG